jgi:hypothetical protein
MRRTSASAVAERATLSGGPLTASPGWLGRVPVLRQGRRGRRRMRCCTDVILGSDRALNGVRSATWRCSRRIWPASRPRRGSRNQGSSGGAALSPTPSNSAQGTDDQHDSKSRPSSHALW